MHLFKKEKRTPWEKATAPVRDRWKKAARKWKHWKLYFFLFVTLPLFIVSLIVKITETLVRIKLRESATAVPMEAAATSEPERNGQEAKDRSEAKDKSIPVPVELEKVELEKFEPEKI